MTDRGLTFEQCQEHAKTCRDMARREPKLETKKSLEDLAVQWEHLCEELSLMADGKT